MSTDNPTADFDLEFYKAHRAHEAVLNTATAAHEQSLLKLVLITNAASIGVFATLLLNETKGTPTISFYYYPAIYAFYIWAVGVVVAILATCCGYQSQSLFTQAYRFRRQAVEIEKTTSPDWSEKLGVSIRDKDKVDKKSAENPDGARVPDRVTKIKNLRCEASKNRNRAANWGRGALWLGMAAFVAAGLGFIFAIASVHEGVPVSDPFS